MGPYPKTARLKDGTEIILRPMQDDDLDASHRFFLGLPEEDRAYLRYDVTDREILRLRMEPSDAEERWRIVALDDEKIIGDALLIRPQHGWMMHTGELRCIIAHEYQGKGLGRMMLAELLQEATRRGVEKLIGSITAEQVSARKITERLGFREELVRPAHQRSLDGELQDVILMTVSLREAWSRMEDLMQGMDGVGRESHPRKKRSRS